MKNLNNFFSREVKILKTKFEKEKKFENKQILNFFLVISNDILQVFESIFQVQEIVMSVLFDYGFLLWLQTVIQTSSVFIAVCFFQNDLCFILLVQVNV